ncbi:MFS transporter [Anaerosinus gibii]|uniref:MFS transporter n=1 Tax=Selenobaculum gibii TaxID=3054208 RepID=A0A9Y2ETM5_9FIRM|nr:MFS transporter [Selenobaculum gbiensis]WIW70220.1 MFS transporter [Selenobaculum gbiensis]
MNWQRNLWTLCFSVIFSAASYTMIIPFLPVYLLELGVSEGDISLWSGVVFSASFLIAAIMAPIWGRSADKNGKKRMVLRAGYSLAACYVLGAIVTNPLQLLGVRILQGFANGFLPASLAIVASSVPNEKLGFSLGCMQTGLLIGSIIGPLLGGTLSHYLGMRMAFFAAAGALFLVTVAVAFLVREPESTINNNPKGGLLDDLKIACKAKVMRELLLLTFVVQLAIMVLQPIITLYIGKLQGSMEGVAFTAGLVFSLGGFAGAFSAPVWGRIGQNKGYFNVLAITFLGAGIFCFLQFFPKNVFMFGALQFMVGIFIVGINPAISAILVNASDEGFRGRIFGLLTTANQLGSMVGPLVGGMIATLIGIEFVFVFTGTLLILISIGVFIRYMKKNNA